MPFVPDLIVDLTSAQRRVLSQLWDMNEESDALAEADIATAAAEVLVTAAGLTEPASSRGVPINALAACSGPACGRSDDIKAS